MSKLDGHYLYRHISYWARNHDKNGGAYIIYEGGSYTMDRSMFDLKLIQKPILSYIHTAYTLNPVPNTLFSRLVEFQLCSIFELNSDDNDGNDDDWGQNDIIIFHPKNSY